MYAASVMYADKMQNFVTPTTFGPEPQKAYCPNCQKVVHTVTETKASAITWLICCLTGFWCILCMDCTKDIIHHCPVCHAYLGRYKR